jgi:hypothetical protein
MVAYYYTLKMETVSSSETSLRATRLHEVISHTLILFKTVELYYNYTSCNINNW